MNKEFGAEVKLEMKVMGDKWNVKPAVDVMRIPPEKVEEAYNILIEAKQKLLALKIISQIENDKM